MAKCKRCGRKGLFFKVNSDSLCSDCAAIVAEDKRLAEAQQREHEEREREKSHRELEQKIRTEMQQEMEELKELNRQKTEQPTSSADTITVTVEYSGYPDIIITSNNKYLNKGINRKVYNCCY